MRIELPCEMVRDLLPNYIDELASDSTKESVEMHLKRCNQCEAYYQNMKSEYKQDLFLNDESQKAEMEKAAQEKALFRKINMRVNKKVRNVAVIGVIAVLLVFGAMQLLFNAAIKTIPLEEVEILASVYALEDLPVVSNDETDGVTVTISKNMAEEDGQPENSCAISVPGWNDVYINLTESVLEQCEYMSTISFKSPYMIRNVDYDIQTMDGQRVMCISGFKTTMFNNKTIGEDNIMPTMQFEKIDKIVYTHENGTQTVLWENGEV